MKTFLPSQINTIQEAEDFLTELHQNGEAFHPEDSAHDVVWYDTSAPTLEELNKLDVLMEHCFEWSSFNPIIFLLKLHNDD